MRPREVVRFAVSGLSTNKLRSALTTLGIVIGVGAVILLVAVGNGVSRSVQADLQELGTNSLIVLHTSGGFGPFASTSNKASKNLTINDAKALADRSGAPDVKSVSPVKTEPQTATYEGASHDIAQFIGTYPSYFEASNSPVSKGTYFTNDDVVNARKVVVIGPTVKTDLFGSVDPLGEQILLGGVPFTVVGILTSKGSSGFQDADDTAIAPLSTVEQSLTGYGSLTSITVQATSPTTVDAAESEITTILDRRHGITSSADRDFQVLNQADLLSAATSTTHTLTVLLGAVAAISLLVGGIGITNIMLVTVAERTREIGIRKAIGAPKSAIMGQFLAEATLLSVIGGTLGVIAGAVGSRFTIFGVRPAVVPSSIVLALGVTVVIGLFFGSYPANRAASLHPIEALRYE